MQKALRLLMTASIAAVVAFTVTTSACTPDDPVITDEERDKAACIAAPYECTKCKTNEWCGGTKDRFKWICRADGGCTRVCTKTADCRADQNEVCEDAVCRPPACGNDAQCSSGEHCIGGSCKPAITAASVTSCIVLPTKALLHQGSEIQFQVVAKTGELGVPYKGEVAWTVESAGGATANTATGGITGGSTTATGKIKASIGSTVCTPSDVVNYAAQTGNEIRVVVADLLTKSPIAGAKVVVGNEDPATTDANGIATVDGVPGKPTVSVFHADYSYVSLLEVNSKDLVVFLKAPVTSAKFTGTMSARKFDNLSDLKGNIHLAINGASIPGNLLDIQLSTLLGDSVPTTLELSPTQKFDLSLPAGIVIGLGEQMFKGDYEVLAAPGVRALWSVGGNAEFGAISSALAPVIGGNTDGLDVGGILASILPLVGKLQSGVLTGQTAVSGQSKVVDIELDKLLRLKLLAKVPDLPKYNVGTEEFAFEGAVVIGGALHQPQGLVPLGLTAGVDQKGATDAAGKEIGDGKIDPAEDSDIPAGSLALRLSPLHAGLETSPIVNLALAASFSGLVSTDTAAERKPLVLAGLVTFPGAIDYTTDTAKTVEFAGGFVGIPENPTLSGRAFQSGSAVAGASIHRLDIGGVDTGEWYIYFPAGSEVKTFDIPTPPAGFDDRFTKTAAGSLEVPTAVLQTIRFNTTGTALDYDKMIAFDAENMDDLSKRIDGFSTREIIRPDLAP